MHHLNYQWKIKIKNTNTISLSGFSWTSTCEVLKTIFFNKMSKIVRNPEKIVLRKQIKEKINQIPLESQNLQSKIVVEKVKHLLFCFLNKNNKFI